MKGHCEYSNEDKLKGLRWHHTHINQQIKRGMKRTVVGEVDGDLADKDLKENNQEGNPSIDQCQPTPMVVLRISCINTTFAAVQGNNALEEKDDNDNLSRDLEVLHDGRHLQVHNNVAGGAGHVILALHGCCQPDAESETDDPGGYGHVCDRTGVSREGPTADQHCAFCRDGEPLVDDDSSDCDPSALDRKTLFVLIVFFCCCLLGCEGRKEEGRLDSRSPLKFRLLWVKVDPPTTTG